MNEKMVLIEQGDRAAALRFLQERATEGNFDSAELSTVCCMDDDINHGGADYVHQNPGSFIHNFAIGQVSTEQVVEIAEKFDIFTSHAGCGAVGLVFDHIAGDVGARGRFEVLLGAEKVAQILQNPSDKDALGKAYSAEIAKRAKTMYHHLPVDRVEANGHAGHSAAIAIIDLANAFHGPDMQGAGAYVIDSTADVLPSFSAENALTEAITYGPLAEVIGHGGHSHVPKDQIFTLLVVSDEDHAELGKQIEEQVSTIISESNLGEKLQVMYFTKAELKKNAQ